MNDKLLEILSVDELKFLVATMYKEILSLRNAMLHLETCRELIEEKEGLYMEAIERLHDNN